MCEERSHPDHIGNDLLGRRFHNLLTASRCAYLGVQAGDQFRWLVIPTPDWLQARDAALKETTRAARQLCSQVSLLGVEREGATPTAMLAAAPILDRSGSRSDARLVPVVAMPRSPYCDTPQAEPVVHEPPKVLEEEWRYVSLVLVRAVCEGLTEEVVGGRVGDGWHLWSEASEEERQRIGRDIHDEMSQLLAGIFLRVQRLERVLPPAADEARREITAIKDMVHEVVVETSRMISELRQPALDRGLWDALGGYVDQWSRENEVVLERRFSGDDGMLAPEQQIAVYRMVQEALNNIRKHARAKKAYIIIRLSTKSLHGRIIDDGIGFDPHSVRKDVHFGLTGMCERASVAGGRLRIDSSPGRGTTIIFWLPHGKRR